MKAAILGQVTGGVNLFLRIARQATARYDMYMPDKRTHRGPHPDDALLFADSQLERLRQAMADYVLLLSKGYAQPSSLKLVGDRFELSQRQRVVLMRSACTGKQRVSRLARRTHPDQLAGEGIAIDGYNVLITIESALSGGVLMRGVDGCIRDLASVHSTYRHVSETLPALELIGSFLAEARISPALWLLDSPVSNSGRLKKTMVELAHRQDWRWDIQLVTSPDAELRRDKPVVATTDSAILDGCGRWIDLAGEIITSHLPKVHIIELGGVQPT